LWTWVRQNPVASLTIAGLLLYGSLRLSAGIFYARFGVAPEDVGFGYTELIARSIFGLGFLLITLMVIRFVVMPLLLAVGLFVYRLIRPQEGKGRLKASTAAFTHGFGRGTQLSVDDLVFDLVVFVVVLAPIMFAFFDGIDASNGVPLDPVFTGISWRAEAARIYQDSPSSPVSDGQCILYLGAAEGFTVVYDPKTKNTWRVAATGVVVQTGGLLDDVDRVPDDC
jgi:hypothetical protein